MVSYKCQQLKNLDLFGFPVSLYYEGNEKVKKSVFGALVSIMISTLFIVYVLFLTHKVINPNH